MAQFIEITDTHDPRLADYVSLRDVVLRKSIEAEQGLFIAEGAKVIRRALEAGYRPRSFLLAERWIAGLSDLLDVTDAPAYVVTEAAAEQITGFHVHRGALASLHREARHSLDDLLGADRLVVAEDIVDHTNIGAIIRCAAGLGWDGLLLSPRAADPLYRRSIKTSMGTVFSLAWARMNDWSDDLLRLREAGFTIAAMALSSEAVDLRAFAAQLDSSAKIALLVGTEGDGLSEHWLSQADVIVTIPMAGGVDSLNVAAATAIACYELAPEGAR